MPWLELGVVRIASLSLRVTTTGRSVWHRRELRLALLGAYVGLLAELEDAQAATGAQLAA
jgi:hypothetical protein